MNNHGLVMVFIEQVRGVSRTTGSYGYYIVPITNEPTFLKSEKPSFKDASGLTWKQNHKEWVPEGCEVTVGESPSLENRGAYSISRCDDRFLVDSGFKRNGLASVNRDGSSKIIGPNGASCTVTNSRIFDYTNKDEPKLKLRSSSEIKSFLRLIPACAHLLDAVKPAAAVKKSTT